MALKKSELYSSLWKSCDELRGGMDASQYKDYVLVLLFVKDVSDKYAGDPNALLEVPSSGVELGNQKDENQMGELQSFRPAHLGQSGTGQEVSTVPGIYSCA